MNGHDGLIIGSHFTTVINAMISVAVAWNFGHALSRQIGQITLIWFAPGLGATGIGLVFWSQHDDAAITGWLSPSQTPVDDIVDVARGLKSSN